MNLILRATSHTDKGQVYEHNEDSVFTQVRPPEYGEVTGLLVVADGVGGHKAGEIASKIVIDTIREDFKPVLKENTKTSSKSNTRDIEELEALLRQAIQDANLVIYNYAQANQKDAGDLGSTVTCAVVIGDKAIIANVGDSRTYHYHDGQMEQITLDHSLVGEMIRKGIVAPEEIFTHPHRSVITRALGNEKEIEVDTFLISLKSDDRLFLCSDGLWEMIHSSQEISETLSSDNDLDKVAKIFVDLANNYGGKDNIGVVVAELTEG
jgi:protein phosphatase